MRWCQHRFRKRRMRPAAGLFACRLSLIFLQFGHNCPIRQWQTKWLGPRPEWDRLLASCAGHFCCSGARRKWASPAASRDPTRLRTLPSSRSSPAAGTAGWPKWPAAAAAPSCRIRASPPPARRGPSRRKPSPFGSSSGHLKIAPGAAPQERFFLCRCWSVCTNYQCPETILTIGIIENTQSAL